jgi:hypothetical protein
MKFKNLRWLLLAIVFVSLSLIGGNYQPRNLIILYVIVFLIAFFLPGQGQKYTARNDKTLKNLYPWAYNLGDPAEVKDKTTQSKISAFSGLPPIKLNEMRDQARLKF